MSDSDSDLFKRLNALKKSSIQPHSEWDIPEEPPKTSNSTPLTALHHEIPDSNEEDEKTLEELMQDLGPEEKWSVNAEDEDSLHKLIQDAQKAIPLAETPKEDPVSEQEAEILRREGRRSPAQGDAPSTTIDLSAFTVEGLEIIDGDDEKEAERVITTLTADEGVSETQLSQLENRIRRHFSYPNNSLESEEELDLAPTLTADEGIIDTQIAQLEIRLKQYIKSRRDENNSPEKDAGTLASTSDATPIPAERGSAYISLPSVPTAVLPSVPTSVLSATPRSAPRRRRERSDLDAKIASWCCICCANGAVRCFGCGRLIYCMPCFSEGHLAPGASIDMSRHDWDKYQYQGLGGF
ncbi:MAG: hypothetical protein M1829_005200 [Trizodia sp. TS-e1964]|nr:MAG: hypothetical protein M1829_005200 [Trizodia sp. TS-e1964]